jgi:hypothetical protein
MAGHAWLTGAKPSAPGLPQCDGMVPDGTMAADFGFISFCKRHQKSAPEAARFFFEKACESAR